MDRLFKKGHIGLLWAAALGVVASTFTWVTPSISRTWYVKVDGTGDAPTIQAGIDSAVSGDTVLLGAGQYFTFATIHLKSGVALVGELGPTATTITVRGEWPGPPVVGIDMEPGSEINGLWVDGASIYTSVGANNRTRVQNCIIFGGSFSVSISGDAEVVSCLIENIGCSSNASGVLWKNVVLQTVYYDGIPLFVCNDIVGEIPPPIASDTSNFSLEPQYCGNPGSGNYFLQSDSPCAPGNHPNGVSSCGLIGPLPVGCATVATQESTWGGIKEMYYE